MIARYSNTSCYYSFGMVMDGRNYTAGSGYRYGFNGKEKINEINVDDGSYDFGARIYEGRLGRWLAVDMLTGKYTNQSPYHFGYNNPIITIDPDGKENIIVVGGQNDNSISNKLMFVHQGLRQLKNYKKTENDETRTMVLFTEGYTQKQLNKIEKRVNKLGATLVKVNTSKEVTNYINSKATDDNCLTTNRIADPATDVDVYAHGIVGSIEFGYEQKNADAARFDASDAARLNPLAFVKEAVFTSYACRTGLGNPDISTIAYSWENLDADMSLAQVISNTADITVKAYLTRTDYSNTLSSSQERLYLKLYERTGMGNKRKETIEWYNKWQDRLKGRENVDGATFDPEGAVHPVTGGSSPMGVSNDIQTYTPKN